MSQQSFDIHKANQEMTGAIHASPRGEELMGTLCREVGPRPPGSAAMRQAVELLAEEWRGFGAANVHTEPVPLMAWDEAESSVEVTAPIQRSYASVQCVYSGSGIVEGRVIDAGDLSSEELGTLGEGIRGAIVLMKGHEISGGKHEPIQKKIDLAEKSGAAGVLLASSYPKLPAIECMFRSTSIPVISLSGNDASELGELASQQTVQVRIKAEGQARKGTCQNLVGEIGPDEAADELIILSAHLDGYYLAPCAFDNLSGVVTLTETARALALYKGSFTRTLRIIAYTGEEFGFLGSKEYVRAHIDELDRIRFVLNLDGLFDDTARGLAVMWAPELRDYIDHALRDLGSEVDVRNMFCMSSDYLPFMLEGIPTARPATYMEWYPPWSHTIEDTEDKVPPEWLKSNAVMCARVLLRILTDQRPLPSPRKTAQEVRELIEREDVEEALWWQGNLE